MQRWVHVTPKGVGNRRVTRTTSWIDSVLGRQHSSRPAKCHLDGWCGMATRPAVIGKQEDLLTFTLSIPNKTHFNSRNKKNRIKTSPTIKNAIG